MSIRGQPHVLLVFPCVGLRLGDEVECCLRPAVKESSVLLWILQDTRLAAECLRSRLSSRLGTGVRHRASVFS